MYFVCVVAPTCLSPEQVKQHRATALAPRNSSQCGAVDRRRAGERSQGVSDAMVSLSRSPTSQNEPTIATLPLRHGGKKLQIGFRGEQA